MLRVTWDGLPVSTERPYGASVLVWRTAGARVEWLVLHRAHQGPLYAGDWAWGPPAGARLPGEPVAACAARELREETGLELPCRLTACGSEDWVVFEAQAGDGDPIALSAEHDAYAWLTADEAASRCLPAAVGASVRCVAAAHAAPVPRV